MKNNNQQINNYNIQTGYLFDTNGKKFDISVILNFPTETDYDNCTGLDDFPSVNLIDFYFGEPNDSDTETFVKQFIEKQNKLQKLLTKLYELKSQNPDDTEIDEQIDFVKSQIHKLY
jgi:hypothetical protein